MSWHLDFKKYRKLAKEVIFHRSELELVEEALKEYHIKFDEYQIQYCLDNDIDLQKLQQENAVRVDKIIPQPKQQLSEEGIIVSNDKSDEQKQQSKEFGKVYKLIAKKIHPDKFSNRLRTEEIEEKEEMFKSATDAYEKCDWAKMLEVSEELKIKPGNLKPLCREIRKEILKLKEKIKRSEGMYSWKFYLCEDNKECQDLLIKAFLKHLFKYEQ
tara:strand:- start:269 stop:910 length:642 start_codon:yes stop_codon:yes gene_type:complete